MAGRAGDRSVASAIDVLCLYCAEHWDPTTPAPLSQSNDPRRLREVERASTDAGAKPRAVRHIHVGTPG